MARTTACGLVLALILSGAVVADEGDAEWFDGVVSVTRDEGGKVTKASLKVIGWDENDNEIAITYHIELDKVGLSMAALHGKSVEVKAVAKKKTVNDKQELWLTVQRFALLEEEEEAQDLDQ